VEKWGEMQAREADLEARRLLLSSVAAAYYNAQLAMKNITIAEADETFNQRQVTEAEARLQVGTGALSDVLNFKVQVNAARSQRNQAQLAYAQYRIGLAALMGMSDAGLPDNLPLSPLVPETTAEMKMPDVGAQISEALAHRPDLKQSELRIRQASSQIELARAEYYPTLSFDASLNGQRYDNMAYETDDFGYSVGLTLSCNLFSGGATRAKIHEAVWARTEAEKNHADLSITLAQEVRNAIAELKRAQAELKLQRANTVLVQKNRDLVQKEYASGQGTLVRLTEAQRDLTTAQSRLALALVSLRMAWENLKTATGLILSDHGTDPNQRL
jgi:outer membrane protein TolC